ncbi:MAG: restriction endonuclease subunit S [Bacillota bacterium]|nr:restriction endonuclease subunit S [Bacillota bacterium]
MRTEYPARQLGELVENLDSRRIPLSSRVRAQRRGPYPYYGATGVMDHIDGYLFDGLHLLVAEDGSVEREDGAPFIQLVQGKFWVNNHAHVLRGVDDEDTKYIYYALSTVPVRPFVTGSVQPKLSQANLNRIPIPYPPDRATRRATVRVLSTLDEKIDLNRRMSETLEAMARAIFKAWFVDFEPVRAKMEGRWRRGESLPGLPQHLYDLFPEGFADSELGAIPEGWRVEGLNEIAQFLNGLALQQYRPGTGPALPVIKIAQLRKGDTDGADRCSADVPVEYIVDDGDVLFSWSGSLECIVWAGGKGALNQHLFKVTSNKYPKWFYYFWIHEHLPEFRSIAADKATTMGHIQRHHLASAQVVVASADVMAAADRVIAPMLERVLTLRLESRTLARLRDALLPKLISGELRLRDAERFIGSAVG